MNWNNSDIVPYREGRKIFFDEPSHKYTDDLDNKYTSATQLLHKYLEEKDFSQIAKACAKIGSNPNHKDYLKYKGKSAADLELEWKLNTEAACDRGNKGHDFLEGNIHSFTNYDNLIKSKFVNGRLYTIEDIIDNPLIGEVTLKYFYESGIKTKYPKLFKLLEQIYKAGFRFYAEVTVYDTRTLICGRIDLLCVNWETKQFSILDWKTNRAPIEFTPGYYKKDIHKQLTKEFVRTNEYFLRPVSHLPASIGHTYSMQLSIYTYLTSIFGLTLYKNVICQINPDINYGDLDITGNIIENVAFVPISYYEKETIAMINDFKLKQAC